MSCGFDRELLSMYADGALEGERVNKVENHISGCWECRRELEFMREIGKALSSLPRAGAPSALIEHIIGKAEGAVRHATLDVMRQTVNAVWTVAMNGFKIEDDREESLRRDLPEWVARWVLFV